MKFVERPFRVKVLEKDIDVFPRVFYPATDTELLIQAVKLGNNERVLEPFAGTGAISIFLAPIAREIIATDINPNAIANITENIRLHHLEKKIKAIQADIFPADQEKFDIIVANPPYTDNYAKDIIEKSMWDKDHETLKRFFREAKKHLTQEGRIYCSWANFADFDFFEKLVRANGYSIELINEGSKEWQVYHVYEIKPE